MNLSSVLTFSNFLMSPFNKVEFLCSILLQSEHLKGGSAFAETFVDRWDNSRQELCIKSSSCSKQFSSVL